MNAYEIEGSILSHLRFFNGFVVPNCYPPNWWECDVFSLTQSGYFREYEIKVNKQDYLRDSEKCKRRGSKTKHQCLAEGHINGPSQFWFVVPEGLLEGLEVPSWAGVLECRQRTTKTRKRIDISQTKAAPRLHSVKLDEKRKDRIERNCYFRYHNLRKKLFDEHMKIKKP